MDRLRISRRSNNAWLTGRRKTLTDKGNTERERERSIPRKINHFSQQSQIFRDSEKISHKIAADRFLFKLQLITSNIVTHRKPTDFISQFLYPPSILCHSLSRAILAKTRKSSAAGFSCPDQRRGRKGNQRGVRSVGTSGSNKEGAGGGRQNRHRRGYESTPHEGTRDPERCAPARV